MSYQLQVIKDNPIAFWPLDEISGTTAIDASGSGNNGTYSGSLTTNILPLVTGGVSGSLINTLNYVSLPISYDYNGDAAFGGLATKYFSDNDFTLECWVYSKILSTSLTPIFADDTSKVGIYYEDGNLVFRVENKRLDFRLPSVDQALHICATYTPTSMSLFVNGERAGSIFYEKYRFTSSTFLPKIGPTANITDSFIIDAPAVYRYALPKEKLNHTLIYLTGLAQYKLLGQTAEYYLAYLIKVLKNIFIFLSL